LRPGVHGKLNSRRFKVKRGLGEHAKLDGTRRMVILIVGVYHGQRNFKDTNPLMLSLLVVFVWGGEAIL
jgi:hypothetical protein